MRLKTSIKVSEEGLKFLKRLRINRIKSDTDEDGVSYSNIIEIIARYFKINNDRYLELVAQEMYKNV